MTRPDAVVVDMDGTLTVRRFGGESHETYRPQLWDPAARTPYDWDRVGEDPPNPPMVTLVRVLHRAGLGIVVTSGRSEVCRSETSQWLHRHGILHDALHMATIAESESGTPDSEVKRRIYTELVAPEWFVIAAFDDRDQVVETWRDLGLMCAQVGPGNF